MIAPAEVTMALEDLKSRQVQYGKYRRYFDGKQDLAFSTDMFRTAFGGLFKSFSYNRCRSVVDAYADRLVVTGWETPGIEEETQTDALGDAASIIWERNRMPKRQGELMAEMFRAGDAYLIVWPDDEGNAQFSVNRGHLIQPVYDEESPDRMLYAVKCWQVQHGARRGHWRVNVYEPDITTRWITNSKKDEYPQMFKGMSEYADDGFPSEVPNPWGEVPIFHFGNNADTGMCGMSELVDVIPLQDGMNKSISDMLVTGEFVAYPQRWAVGIEPVYNPQTGKEEETFKPGVDRIWAVGDKEASFGQFDAADMTQFISAQDAWDNKISRVSRVPIHWLSLAGDASFPSGEALKTAEGPYVAKIKDRQVANGDTYADAMAFALRVEGVTGDDVSVVPIWAPAETRSERETWELAMLKQSAGVPDFQIWAEAGYTQEEIAEFTKAKAEAAKQQQEIFAQSFDRGETEPPGGDE